MEILAWSPRRMPRVASILARLSHLSLPDNWANRPFSSLLGIFRSWLPRTAATLDQRIAVLDKIVRAEPDVAFDLMDRLLHSGPDMAFSSSGPVWRDEDARARGHPTGDEVHGMLIAAAERMIGMAAGHAPRLARLLDKLTQFDDGRADQVLSMVAVFTESGAYDADRELLRAALRKLLHWHLNYGSAHTDAVIDAQELGRWRELYDQLAPSDPILRDRWLFQSNWVELPIARADDHSAEQQEREDLQRAALLRVYEDSGLPGVLRLAELSGDASIIGRFLLEIVPDRDRLTAWVVEVDADLTVGTAQAALVSGLLRWLPDHETEGFLRYVADGARLRQWAPSRIAALLRLARDERLSWDTADECGEAVAEAYWRVVTPWVHSASVGDREFAVERLLAVGRPIAALHVSSEHGQPIQPALLARALEEALRSPEPDARFPGSWELARWIERLEAWDGMDVGRLLQLEFQLIPAFRVQGLGSLKALTEAVTSRPEIFAELICLVFRPESQEEHQGEGTGADRLAFEHAWQLFEGCRRQPGTTASGEIDDGEAIRFVDGARALCEAQDRRKMGEMTLGKILAHAPEGPDGIWPGSPARDILDRSECDAMRRGFETGTFNKRGVTVRSPDAGGDQERELAAWFRRQADALAASHPHLSASLEGLARTYEARARREDVSAALTRERY